MKDEASILRDDGTFDLAPEYFDDWIISETCSPYMERLQQASGVRLQYQFLKGAAAIAIEVQGARYDWSHASKVYASAGHQLGLDAATMERLLDAAWRWTGAGFKHWTDLVREWVCVGDHRQFFHVPSQRSLTQFEFGALFDHLSPIHEWPIVPFLTGSNHILLASHVAIMPDDKPRLVASPSGQAVLAVPQKPREVVAA